MAAAITTFMDTLAPEHIRALPAYVAGKPVEELERELGIRDALKVASNENPLGPSPKAVEAAARVLAEAHRYPDPAAFKLWQALAERLSVGPDELVFGAGSNELIYLIIQAFCRPGHDEVLTHKHAFISYRLASLACGVSFVESEVTAELGCDVDALIAAMSPRTKIVFLANPNNPTGAYVRTPDFERIVAALPERALLVVDDAYYEYAAVAHAAGEADYPHSQRYRSKDMPRILSLRTFSKIYGLAGLRVGYGIGDPRVVELINRVRRPFNVNIVAQAAALAALADDEHLARSQAIARTGVATLVEGARALGIRAYPSLGNFVLLGVGMACEPVYQGLLGRGVIVRPMRIWGLPQHVRMSVGMAEQNQRALAALSDALADIRSDPASGSVPHVR